MRLSALDAAGRTLGSADGSVRTVSLADYIEAQIVDPRLDGHPWLQEAWYEVPVEVRLLPRNGPAASYDRSVPALHLARPWNRDEPTVLHELAHHLTMHPSIHADDPGGRLSVMSLWLYVNVDEQGKRGEVIARGLAGFTRWNGSLYLAAEGVGYDSAEVMRAILASASAGEVPQWFYDTYTSDGTLATVDLDRLWVDFKDVATDPYLGHILDLLDGLFGGYCSTAEATAALPASASLNNPWVDGGCNNRRPQGLSAAAGDSSGEIHLSWRVPLYSTTPAIDRYVVQWKSGTQRYDTARQAIITDLSDLSHTIAGLSTGTEYRIRVAAVNSAGTADLTDDDGRTRTAETTATTG